MYLYFLSLTLFRNLSCHLSIPQLIGRALLMGLAPKFNELCKYNPQTLSEKVMMDIAQTEAQEAREGAASELETSK